MSVDTIRKALGTLNDNVRSLTFSGGEPSLAIDLIEATYEITLSIRSFPNSVYVVTNGVKQSKRFFAAMKKWYELCNCDDEANGMRLSVDKYHPRVDHFLFENFQEDVQNYLNDKFKIEYHGAGEAIISEGNAKGWGKFPAHSQIEVDDNSISGTVDVDGNMHGTCDISYETMKKKTFFISHVDDGSIGFENAIPDYIERMDNMK
jgi:hypothetical protein